MTQASLIQLLQRPKLTRGSLFLLKRHAYEFQKSWMSFLLWACVEPIIYLLAFGFGLGNFVQQVRGEPYMTYFFPGLLCMAVAHTAYLESSIHGFTRFHQAHLYRYLLLSPVTPHDLAAGDVIWNSIRALVSTIPLLLFGWAYGVVHFQTLPALFVGLALVAVTFSAASLAIVAGTRVSHPLPRIFSMVIIPMSFFSGAFFPIDVLPTPLYWILWPLPLHQAILFTRNCLAGDFDWTSGIHCLILVALGAIAFMIATNLTGRRLLKE